MVSSSSIICHNCRFQFHTSICHTCRVFAFCCKIGIEWDSMRSSHVTGITKRWLCKRLISFGDTALIDCMVCCYSICHNCRLMSHTRICHTCHTFDCRRMVGERRQRDCHNICSCHSQEHRVRSSNTCVLRQSHWTTTTLIECMSAFCDFNYRCVL